MYGTIESMGSRLLSLFVPRIEAAAAPPPRCYCYNACWQCAGSSCCIDTACGSIRCGGGCPGC